MRIIFVGIAACVLAGCSQTSGTTPIKIEQVEVYPELPNVEAPPKINLEPIEWDVPRDTTREGNPPLVDSNIFIGVSQENYQKLENNMAKYSGRDAQWQARLDAVNAQRECWRLMNRGKSCETPVE